MTFNDGAQFKEEDGKFFLIKGDGERVEMPEDAWRALQTYRGEDPGPASSPDEGP